MDELWIPIVLFVSVAVTFCTWFFFRHKTRIAMQQTYRLALEKGSNLDPDLLKQLAGPEPQKDADLRRGLVWLALGLATAILGIALDEPDAMGPLLGTASFPALVGLAYLVMWRFGARKE